MLAQFLKFVEDLKSALFKCRTCDIALAWLQVLMLSLPGTVVLLLIQPLLGLRALYISMGWGTSVWTGLHSFFFFFFPDMYFASRNGGVLGFSGNQRTADKSGDHRPQILPWRR